MLTGITRQREARAEHLTVNGIRPRRLSHVQVRALRGSSTEKSELQGSATLVLKLKCWPSSCSLTGRKVGGQFAELVENWKRMITCQPLHSVRLP
jgi:hypothetical protein